MYQRCQRQCPQSHHHSVSLISPQDVALSSIHAPSEGLTNNYNVRIGGFLCVVNFLDLFIIEYIHLLVVLLLRLIDFDLFLKFQFTMIQCIIPHPLEQVKLLCLNPYNPIIKRTHKMSESKPK